jgi:hypothetical protein
VLGLYFIQSNHVNQNDLHVHGDLKMGCILCPSITRDQGFSNGTTNVRILNVFDHGKTYVTCESHHIKDMRLDKDLFLIEQDVKLLCGKLAQKTY